MICNLSFSLNAVILLCVMFALMVFIICISIGTTSVVKSISEVVAGVSPLVGLWTTVVMGFFAAAFGGRAGIQSSASGAVSVVVAALCASRE